MVWRTAAERLLCGCPLCSVLSAALQRQSSAQLVASWRMALEGFGEVTVGCVQCVLNPPNPPVQNS